MKDNGIAPPVTLEAVNFTDEESAIIGLDGQQGGGGPIEPRPTLIAAAWIVDELDAPLLGAIGIIARVDVGGSGP